MDRITERHPIPGPTVYGYIRLPAGQPARRRALTETLLVYCEQHELRLGGVFVDHSDSTVMSAAFTGLLDVLALDGAYGVVTPARAHLGPRAISSERSDLIDQSRRRLMVVRDSARTVAETR